MHAIGGHALQVSETQFPQLGEVLAIGHNLAWAAEHVLNCNNKETVISGCVDCKPKGKQEKIGCKKLSAIAMRLPLVTLAILPAYGLAQNPRHR